MFQRIFGTGREPAAAQAHDAFTKATADDGETATVRRIVARLEALPAEQARLVAATAYTLARAANADLDISDDETHAIEAALERSDGLDEATAVLVTEMAKLQARTVGATEDYLVTRELRAMTTVEQRLDLMHAVFLIAAANGSISAEESAEANQIARELDIEAADLNRVRAEFTDRMSAVQEVRRLAGGDQSGA